jgi:hypothetical protein
MCKLVHKLIENAHNAAQIDIFQKPGNDAA